MKRHHVPGSLEYHEARDVKYDSDEDGRDEQWHKGELLDAQQPDHS